MKVIFTGGGTGGHVMPIVAIGRELRKKNKDVELHYIGSAQDCDVLAKENFVAYPVLCGKIRSYFAFENVVDVVIKIPIGFLQSFVALLVIRPQLVFSKGGPGSVATCLAARILGIPIFLHESDSVPGRSNQIVGKWAKKIFTSFENTALFDSAKIMVVGNPVREELLSQTHSPILENRRIDGRPTIFFFGGSQGAEPINDLVLLVLNELLVKYEVIHMCGGRNHQRVKAASQAMAKAELLKNYHLHEFLNELELKNAYVQADMIVSRAGSGSIFEIAALGKPSILIPLPSSAQNHQVKNALAYAKNGAAVVLEQGSLTPNFFLGELEIALSHTEQMKQKALEFARPNAAEIIAKEILNAV